MERKHLEKKINSLKSQLETFPLGKILCTRNGNRYKWYHSDDHKSVYIPKKQRKFAEQLAIKKYLTLQLEDSIREKKAIDFYLRHHAPSKAEQMLINMPEYQELLSPYFKPISQEMNDWINASYDSNTKYPENKIHKTSSGNMVRSKSEAFIDMALYTNRIPFRYECMLKLGDIVLYPDFTIRDPLTGKTYYWEHFGKMDDPKYAQTVAAKLKLYFEHGIIPGINLIITFETKEKPFTYEDAKECVHRHFKNSLEQG